MLFVGKYATQRHEESSFVLLHMLKFSAQTCDPSSRFLSRLYFHSHSCSILENEVCSKTGTMHYKFSCRTSICAQKRMQILYKLELHIPQQSAFCQLKLIIHCSWTELKETTVILQFLCSFHCVQK